MLGFQAQAIPFPAPTQLLVISPDRVSSTQWAADHGESQLSGAYADQTGGAPLYTDSPKNSLSLLCHYGTMRSTRTARNAWELLARRNCLMGVPLAESPGRCSMKGCDG